MRPRPEPLVPAGYTAAFDFVRRGIESGEIHGAEQVQAAMRMASELHVILAARASARRRPETA